jgi:hypothetical protein
VKHRLLDGSYAFGFVAYKIFSEHVLHDIHFVATSVSSVFIEQQLSYYSLNNPKKFVPLYIWKLSSLIVKWSSLFYQFFFGQRFNPAYI